jgi:addiction module HigA family antidote
MIRIPKNGPPTHPGEMLLEEFLKPWKLTQSELAGKLGVSYPRVNELIHGKRGITPDTALRLEKLFGMDAQFWLNLQLAWDLYHVTHSSTAKELKKIKRLPAFAHPKSSLIQGKYPNQRLDTNRAKNTRSVSRSVV